MVLVGELQLYLDGYLKTKLDMIVTRVSKRNQDGLILFDGNEGSGKTNGSVIVAYYMAQELGREFSHKNVFFDIEEMGKFAVSTKKQVIIWDEAALGGMASEWNTGKQKKLLKLMMTARKKGHIWIFNIPRFFKLNEYLVLDRSLCLIHTYEGKDGSIGNFRYYTRNRFTDLWEEWKRTRKRKYMYYKSFYGHFRWALPKIIDEKAYDLAKDNAIDGVMNEKPSDVRDRSAELKYKVIARMELNDYWKEVFEKVPDYKKAELLGICREYYSKNKGKITRKSEHLGGLVHANMDNSQRERTDINIEADVEKNIEKTVLPIYSGQTQQNGGSA